MIATMRGALAKKQDTAWRFYAGARLKAAGFGGIWERKYLEVPEFLAGCIGSFSEFHFGCR